VKVVLTAVAVCAVSVKITPTTLVVTANGKSATAARQQSRLDRWQRGLSHHPAKVMAP
jgi:hypothetical protein